MSHRRVDGRGRYGNKAIALKGDEPMRTEGLQARGIYKEVPRPSRGLALATRQKIPYSWSLIILFLYNVLLLIICLLSLVVIYWIVNLIIIY